MNDKEKAIRTVLYALVVSIEGSVITILVGDKLYKWTEWDMNEATR